jgi:hypothetical protein
VPNNRQATKGDKGVSRSRVLLSRRALLQATAALAAVGLDEEGATAERHRRFWFLDRRQTGLHDFYHFVGYVDAPIPLPPSPVPDFVGAVSIAPPQDGGGALYVNLAWEVEQVVSSRTHRYRARLTNSQLDDAKSVLADLMPDGDAAGAWMRPADAERTHGIVIRRG